MLADQEQERRRPRLGKEFQFPPELMALFCLFLVAML